MMRRIILLTAALLICSVNPASAQNYQATAGSGTTFGSKFVSSVNYPQFVMCDPTTPSQCVAVNASGQVTVIGTGTLATQVNGFTSWAGSTLGAMANYGTSPGAVLVPGVNAFVTNANPNGQAALASSSPVAIAKNSGTGSTVAGAAVGTAGSPSTEVVTVQGVSSGTPFPVNISDSAATGYIADPCQSVAKTYTPINISASGSIKIITGTSAKKTYICHIDLVTNAANNVAFLEGTGTNCGTPVAGLIGGTTAASGWNFAANSGIAIGNGANAVLGAVNTAADDVCLNPSASTQLSGQVVWVQK